MGSGFDTVGVALELYNYIYAAETDSGLSITVTDPSDKFLPKDENNLVYQGMKAVFDKADYHPAGLKIVLENNIPVTRGLGSSSAGIVGGIIAANALCGNKLSRHELVTIAAKLEGHPDNTTPAITGGVAVAVKGMFHISSCRQGATICVLPCLYRNLPLIPPVQEACFRKRFPIRMRFLTLRAAPF